ncbi:serine dehydratase-like [Centruroides sculpturatus]|uniref:serine dehydratase-like n=1 Tax=Centruroides sculpturatus TaxID=218467 RepID=UPI000C6E1A65|nr:serine dehydratase-like [Centruroides sculpturatus]
MDGSNLYCQTPLIESLPLSKLAGREVYLKLENAQPTSSFKQRGLSFRALEIFKEGYRDVVIASGGNAGMAMAYCARKLGMGATIVVPEATTMATRTKLEQQGARLRIHGSNWTETDKMALQIAKETGAFYIHPFHPTIWKGNAVIVSEIYQDIPSKPSLIVTCVGGGGLLCGIVEGLRDVGWDNVPIVAMETRGAESYNASIKAGKLVTLPKITSIATTLGACTVCPKSFEYASIHKIISEVTDDARAVSSCLKFADDHKMLVEPSCGASLSAVYDGFVSDLIANGQLKREGPVVVVVCGGNDVSLNLLEKWKSRFLNNV